MTHTVRVSLPGYDALTDTDPDHYALIADDDNILIKECARGSFSIGAGGNASFTHNLGYIPMFMAYMEDGTGKKWMYGDGVYGLWRCYATTTKIYFENLDSSSRVVKYYLFYDNI